MNKLAHLVLGAVLAAALAACGGGNTVAEGGIGGTGISSGSISAFSSVVLNGTKFDVDAAGIRVNGDPNGTESDLEVGYVVRVDGDLAKGIAKSIRFDADLIGPVTNLDPVKLAADGIIEIMKQQVRVTATTVLAGTIDAVSDIAPTDQVLVSGFRNSSDELVATHFAVLSSDPATDQVVGKVTVNNTPGEFAIGGLIVASFEDPKVGSTVIVRGTYNPLAAPGPRFQATSVQPVAGLAKTGAEIELEGIVDSISGDPDFFTVAGVPVDASGAMIVDEAGAQATIQKDAEVEVEGKFDVNGVIIAKQVEVELEDNVEIVARVATVDPDQGTVRFFHFAGQEYVVARVSGKTRLKDSRDDKRDFSLADLVPGVDWIELDAFEDDDTDPRDEITALKLERISAETTVSVEGPVDSLSPFAVLGMSFDPGGPLPGGIQVGDIVEVTWPATETFVQPNMPVTSVEEEN